MNRSVRVSPIATFRVPLAIPATATAPCQRKCAGPIFLSFEGEGRR